MKNKKLLILVLVIIILLIVISLVFVIKNNKQNSENIKELGNYKLEKLLKENDYYVYKNSWKVQKASGTLTVEYNGDDHKIKRKLKARDESVYIDTPIDSEIIEGDLILNDNKDSMIVYQNGFIPYINTEKNIFRCNKSYVGF